MMHFKHGINGIPTYEVDTPEEFKFWEAIRSAHKMRDNQTTAEKKEWTTMTVSYNGFTGDIVKLERAQNGGINI